MIDSFSNQQRVRHYYTLSAEPSARWKVSGQGTVSISSDFVEKALCITISDDDGNAIEMKIDHQSMTLWLNTDGKQERLDSSEDPRLLLNPSGENLPYWLSLDNNNQRIRYGKGEMLHSLLLYEFSWSDNDRFSLNTITKNLQQIQITGTTVKRLKTLEIPVNLDPSPHIVSSNEITLEALANNSVSVIENLPEACQKLYATIAGTGINLCPSDFPEFAQAIQYSIVTPNALLSKKLAEKDPIFGYLRITIDPNLGDSPGQPYVLEIWPAGNGSPIHDHGKACAVIKVLHGQIKISWFSALSPDITQPWGSTIAHAGEVTFLSPNYYQIHKLFNPSPKSGGEFCATIQSYQYPAEDTQHYEYFDYIEKGTIKHFLPDSDWSYLEFKSLLRKEWDTAMSQSEQPA